MYSFQKGPCPTRLYGQIVYLDEFGSQQQMFHSHCLVPLQTSNTIIHEKAALNKALSPIQAYKAREQLPHKTVEGRQLWVDGGGGEVIKTPWEAVLLIGLLQLTG